MPVQTVLYGLWPLRYKAWCQRRYGDLFSLRLPHGMTLAVICDPDAIRDVFGLREADFQTDPAMLEPFVGSNSVLSLDGERHGRQRRLLVRAFHGETMIAYGALVAEATERDMATWPVGKPFALRSHLQDITLEVILRAVFGLDDAVRVVDFRARLEPFLRAAGSLLVLNPSFRRELGGRSPWARFLRLRTRLLSSLDEEIARRRQDLNLLERRDILSLLLRARDEEGNGLDDDELRDNLLTMVLAGHDTTATALAWAFDLVLHNPPVLERLTSELAAGQDVYLDAVIKEVLRIRPVIPETGRTLTKPLRVGNTTLGAGVSVAPSILLAHRRHDVYPDPDRFRPERFLGESPELLTWIPFGGGVRRCLGSAFATLEMQVVLRTVLGQARLRAADARLERQRRRAVTLTPRHGTRIVLAQPPATTGSV